MTQTVTYSYDTNGHTFLWQKLIHVLVPQMGPFSFETYWHIIMTDYHMFLRHLKWSRWTHILMTYVLMADGHNIMAQMKIRSYDIFNTDVHTLLCHRWSHVLMTLIDTRYYDTDWYTLLCHRLIHFHMTQRYKRSYAQRGTLSYDTEIQRFLCTAGHTFIWHRDTNVLMHSGHTFIWHRDTNVLMHSGHTFIWHRDTKVLMHSGAHFHMTQRYKRSYAQRAHFHMTQRYKRSYAQRAHFHMTQRYKRSYAQRGTLSYDTDWHTDG